MIQTADAAVSEFADDARKQRAGQLVLAARDPKFFYSAAFAATPTKGE